MSMNFGQALEALKQGLRVRRSGWNGKGMWIALTPGTSITPDMARAGAAKMLAADMFAEHRADALQKTISIAPHIDMKAADGTLVIGWLASQTDMLAEDWEVVS